MARSPCTELRLMRMTYQTDEYNFYLSVVELDSSEGGRRRRKCQWTVAIERGLFPEKSKCEIWNWAWFWSISWVIKLYTNSLNWKESKHTRIVAGGGRNWGRKSPAASSKFQKWISLLELDSSSNFCLGSLGVVLWTCRDWNGGRRVTGEGERDRRIRRKNRA